MPAIFSTFIFQVFSFFKEFLILHRANKNEIDQGYPNQIPKEDLNIKEKLWKSESSEHREDAYPFPLKSLIFIFINLLWSYGTIAQKAMRISGIAKICDLSV